jgi:isoquinoline 1-oxidoreductase subunit beta
MGGLTVTFPVTLLSACALPVIPKRPAPEANDAAGWIRYADGRYMLWIPRVEMGQNILTALKQIACDTLAIEWHQLDAKLPSTRDIGRVRATVGSDSVKDYALPLAQACATLRAALEAGLKSGDTTGVIAATPNLQAAAKSGRHIGRSVPLEQADAIVRGQSLYAADVRRPGMLFGRVLRAPVSPELNSKLSTLNETAAKTVVGFVALVRDPWLVQGGSEGVGIVAATPGALDRIEAALNAQWTVTGSFTQDDINASIDIDTRLQSSRSLRKQIHNDTVDRDAKWDVDLRIDIPLAAHAPIQPRAAVAEFAADGRLQVWVSSQDVFYQRDVIAKRLGLNLEKVTVHGMRVGGAFGGQTICTVELEAALLARAAQRPVKVQWSRSQEFQQGFHRPPSSHRIRARLKNGQLDQWWHAFASSHILFSSAVVPAWLQKLTDVIGDDGVARGAALPYRARLKRSEFDLVRLPVFTGPWRGLGAGPNGLAMESAIDECARVAGADPVAFRLAHLDNPRLARVLKGAADVSNWSATRRQNTDAVMHGRGVACGSYKGSSYAAVVADVSVNTSSGEVRVSKMWCAHDCGLVVNPDQVRAQCEGNLVWGAGMVLIERLSTADSRVAAHTLGDSPIPLFADVPEMEVLLINEGDAPGGAGETAIVAAGAAVANAVRDALRHIQKPRLCRVPIRAADVQIFMR